MLTVFSAARFSLSAVTLPPIIKSALLRASVTLTAVLAKASLSVSATAVVVTLFCAIAAAFSSPPLTLVVAPFSSTLAAFLIFATVTAALTRLPADPLSFSIVETPASASTSLIAWALTLVSPLLCKLPFTMTLALFSVSATAMPAEGSTPLRLFLFFLLLTGAVTALPPAASAGASGASTSAPISAFNWLVALIFSAPPLSIPVSSSGSVSNLAVPVAFKLASAPTLTSALLASFAKAMSILSLASPSLSTGIRPMAESAKTPEIVSTFVHESFS